MKVEHTAVKLTTEQRNNLITLAQYLLGGKLKARFDMGFFTEFENEWVSDRQTECGTVGCALGHGPYAGIEKAVSEDWIKYGVRCFTPFTAANTDFSPWDWCFGGAWEMFDNTPKGAARRIVYMLVFGVPDLFDGYAVDVYRHLIGNNWEFICTQFPELLSDQPTTRSFPMSESELSTFIQSKPARY